MAGSLRRRKPRVRDVEILFIPRWEERQLDLVTRGNVNLAEEAIARLEEPGILTRRRSTIGSACWGPRNKLALHRGGIPVDFFATTRLNWWNNLFMRTGPTALNLTIASLAIKQHCQWHASGSGFTRDCDGQVSHMTSEEEIFAFVGLPYKQPWERE